MQTLIRLSCGLGLVLGLNLGCDRASDLERPHIGPKMAADSSAYSSQSQDSSAEPSSDADQNSSGAADGSGVNSQDVNSSNGSLSTASMQTRTGSVTVGTNETMDADTNSSNSSDSGGILSSIGSAITKTIYGDPDAKLEIKVSGRQLLVDGKPFTIKGVCYNPVRKGQNQITNSTMFVNPSDADLKAIEKDFSLMKDAGINTLRTYEVIRDSRVLALLNKYGLFVIVPAMNVASISDAQVKATVSALKDHRSTLMWQIGNEWNYNALYSSIDQSQVYAKIASVAKLIKSADDTHPVTSDYGDIPTKAIVDSLSAVDVWGLNIYSGKTFGDHFKQWAALSSKPMFIGEFGADAVNRDHVDENAQAEATEALVKEILANLSAKSSSNVALGGTIFEWNDEWWKDSNGSDSTHDMGGIAPGGGPFPDGVFNEEWWGIVDIDRNPRPAYNVLKNLYN